MQLYSSNDSNRNKKKIIMYIIIHMLHVRPILEYCSVVWSPITLRKKDTYCIEKVQRGRFIKRLPSFKSMSQTDRLGCLGLTSLELHWLHLDKNWSFRFSVSHRYGMNRRTGCSEKCGLLVYETSFTPYQTKSIPLNDATRNIYI